MNTFTSAVQNQTTQTTNGMKARVSTASACVDLFFKIGASRGNDIIPTFVAAYVEDKNLALRIAQWARDVRGGAGERKLFRDILNYLEVNDSDAAIALINKVPEIGRWDDLFVFKNPVVRGQALRAIADAIKSGNGLAAKWAPRKGSDAVELRSVMGLSPKAYRKTLVNTTNVVEQKMCAKDWDSINFSHVPSLAHARYRSAFYRNTKAYADYVESLVKGDDKTVKVNAGAVYPYDVIRGMVKGMSIFGSGATVHVSKTELDLITKQWEALENFIGDSDILPMVDVSGSMGVPAGNNKNLTCLDVAVSLGLYCADKNTGKFKDTFLTFSDNPELLNLKGDIVQKVDQMVRSKW